MREFSSILLNIVILGAIIATLAVWNLKPSEPRQVVRFDCDLPEGPQFSIALAVSSDGKQFVYGTSKGLYLRSVNELTAKLLPSTDRDSQQPFFSPDGQWIGYWSNTGHALKKIAINGGAPVTLCAVQQLAGASWNADNTIVYGGKSGDIMRVSANGGTPEFLVKAKSEILVGPQILPDGKSVLFTNATSQPNKIMVQSLKSGKRKELFAAENAQYLPTGHIAYTLPDSKDLFAIPFDLDRLEVKGGPVPIVEGVFNFAISDSGTLVYLPGDRTKTVFGSIDIRTLVWVSREGKEEPIGAPPNGYRWPKISPDGTRVALTISEPDGYDIWIWNFVRKTMTRQTFDKKNNQFSIWTPDSKRIVYFSYREGGVGGIYWKAADGTGEDEKLGSAPDRALFPGSFSKDGKTLVIMELFNEKVGIGTLSMEGDHARKSLLQHEYAEGSPTISPDGRWMAYSSNESGKDDVYVRPFPDVNKGKWPVSTSGGSSPLWSPNGRELFYFSNDSVMALSVETEPTFSLGIPKALFRGTEVGVITSKYDLWDISPDGKRFLMMKKTGSPDKPAAEIPRKINIVLNWLEELKQRVPMK